MKNIENNLNQTILNFMVILGISFWFIIGFPFGNQNESYGWMIIFDSINIKTALFEHKVAANYRPLGQIFAYILYILDGHKINIVQIFNYLVCVVSYLYLLRHIKFKLIFTILCFMSGAIYFSGYIYLFHLHGIFYSPIIFFIALLFFIFNDFKVSFNNKLLLLIIITGLFTLFHPFAVPMSVAYTYGYSLENNKYFNKNNKIILILFSICSALLMFFTWVFTWGGNREFDIKNFTGFIVSYKLVDLNYISSVFSMIRQLWNLISYVSSKI